MNEIKQMTVSDPMMQILKNHITHAWPETFKSYKTEVKPYFNYRTELVQYRDIVLKGERVVIPVQFKTNILEKIHVGHQVQGKFKCQYTVSVFWPDMNKDIE